MTTTSRRISAKTKTHKPSHTAGRDKGGNCAKTELKTWGASANPYKLKGGALHRFHEYSEMVKGLNK